MSDIQPTRDETELRDFIIGNLYWLATADRETAAKWLADAIATHTRQRAESAEARVKETAVKLDEWCAAGLADYHRELEAAKQRITELAAKLDAVEIDNIGHAHALSMLRGLFGLPLDGTLYDEIWQRHLELMEADKLAGAAIMQVGNKKG
jgi:hypothetical protein